MNISILAAVAALGVCVACTGEPPAPETPPTPYELARPNVEMHANPAPDLTYWAPEGSVITNHPDVQDVWFADVNGQRVATYFGDECRASEYQRLVGQPLQSMPTPPQGIELRNSCTGCPVNADLRRNRINVLFNQDTQVIEQIACY